MTREHGAVRAGMDGQALVVVLVFLVVGLLVLSSSLGWLSTNARLIDRNNRYFSTVAAAEAATEKVVAHMSSDYQRGGAGEVLLRTEVYRRMVPWEGEAEEWADFEFCDRLGNAGQIEVEQVTPWGLSGLISQYSGLAGYASTYRVVGVAREAGLQNPVVAAVQQELQIATIPLFQFAIFYNIDLEVNPGPVMDVNGRVHSNVDLYTSPGSTLNFLGDVTAAGNVYHYRKENGGLPGGTIVYHGEHDSGVNTLNLPLGVENTPENVRQIIQPPPAGESSGSALAQQRYYNKADLVITVKDNTVEVRGGALRAGWVTLPASEVSSFLRTNVTFFNKREGKKVQATEIDVAKLKRWSEEGNVLTSALGRDVSSIYVTDARSQRWDTQAGVRLVNGQELPALGLTVATAQPLYVQGHYNAPSSALGTHDTRDARPAALIADAITVLSGSWRDSSSTLSLSNRKASNTTVNAAFLSGIVPTEGSSYSGGVENFPRFLEDWGGRKLTYNGSMIVLFPSEVATAAWRGTGNTYGIYNPPARDWAFDLNFLDPARLPPGTPEVRAVIRGGWSMVSAGVNGEQ